MRKSRWTLLLAAMVMIVIYTNGSIAADEEDSIASQIEIESPENTEKETSEHQTVLENMPNISSFFAEPLQSGASIPEDAFEYNGHYYKAFDDSVEWHTAKEKCEAIGGHLVSITDEDEQKFVESILPTDGVKQYFIGAVRGENLESWRWITSEKWEYCNWRYDQPDNNDGFQTCVRMVYAPQYNWQWEWDDIAVESDSKFENGYICEWDDVSKRISIDSAIFAALPDGDIKINGKLTLSSSMETSSDILSNEVSAIKWTSSDQSVVSDLEISCTGVNSPDNYSAELVISFTPHKEGKAIITGTISNGLTASCEVAITNDKLQPVKFEIEGNANGKIGVGTKTTGSLEFDDDTKITEEDVSAIINSITWKNNLNIAKVSGCTYQSVQGNKVTFDIEIECLSSGTVTIEGETSNGLKSSFQCRSNYFAAGIDTNQFFHSLSEFYSGKYVYLGSPEYDTYSKQKESEFCIQYPNDNMIYVVDKAKEPSGAIYTTNTNYFNRLTFGLPKNKKKKICSELLKKWDGSCYGLALSMILASQGYSLDGIGTSFWESRIPINNNIALRSTINFYQLVQYLDEGRETEIVYRASFLRPFSSTSQEGFLDDLISEAKRSEREHKPFLLGCGYSDGGHAVIVCGISSQQEDKYGLKIYDPNSYEMNLSGYDVPYLSFEIDKSTHKFSFVDAGGNAITDSSFRFLSYTGIDSIFNTIYQIGGGGSSKGRMRLAAKAADMDHEELVVSAYKKCTITNSSGQYLVCDGENYSGTMKVYSVKTGGEGENTSLAFTVDKSNSFEFKDFDSEISLAANISDNYYMSKVKGADSVVLNQDTGILINSNSSYVFTSTIGAELDSCEVAGISGKTIGQCQIISKENEISFKSENDCTDTVIKTMKDSEVKTEAIANELSSINISDSDDNTVVIVSNAGKNATYSITYDFNGGNVSGNPTSYTADTLPITLKNPTRSGYTFIGWTGSNGSTPQKTVTIKKNSIGNKAYKANWSKNQNAKISIKSAKISLKKISYTYDGKKKQPSVTVRDSLKTLKKGKDYKVTYKHNQLVGTASVIIKGLGKYTDKTTKKFEIVPKGTSLSEITEETKGFTVSWKKQAEFTDGYQVQYSTSKKFTKKVTVIKTVKGSSKTKLHAKKCKAKKKYCVRIRTYKIAKGKKYYSVWSPVKAITTKK